MTTDCHNEQYAWPQSELDEQTERLLVNLDRSLESLRRGRSDEALVGEIQAVVDELREAVSGLAA